MQNASYSNIKTKQKRQVATGKELNNLSVIENTLSSLDPPGSTE